MSLSGSLATMLLGDLLQWCGNNLMTGTITLRRGPIEKKLFFKKGRLFSSTSSSPRETLGQYLIRSGCLTEEELFKALIEQDRTDRRLGQILLSTNAITEEVLEELLRLKTEEAIYDCFLWEDGEFTFEDDVLPDSIPVFVPLEVTGVILEGARRSDEWRRIHEVFPSRLSTFDVDRAAVAEATDLSEEDQRVLELIERGKNLAEISLELHAVEFYAASRLLELHTRKLVTVKDSPDETDFDTQVKELREKLDTGASLYHAGDYQKALEKFQAALEIDPQNKHATLFKIKIEAVLEDLDKFSEISTDAVPRLKVTLSELSKLDLDPQEGFVLSRVNGEWDVDSIMKICPMIEQDVLVIFHRLLDKELIGLD
jgi:tetratricopeptide (TPR) repeat protein